MKGSKICWLTGQLNLSENRITFLRTNISGLPR